MYHIIGIVNHPEDLGLGSKEVHYYLLFIVLQWLSLLCMLITCYLTMWLYLPAQTWELGNVTDIHIKILAHSKVTECVHVCAHAYVCLGTCFRMFDYTCNHMYLSESDLWWECVFVVCSHIDSLIEHETYEGMSQTAGLSILWVENHIANPNDVLFQCICSLFL